jgi:hypothetical protein
LTQWDLIDFCGKWRPLGCIGNACQPIGAKYVVEITILEIEMKKTVFALALACVSFLAHATPIYVGSYKVSDGPSWATNPAVYSATEAAALLFGGAANDYFVSTSASRDYTTITHTGWYDGWGEHAGMELNENYKLDAGMSGYNAPGGAGSARSAYVHDRLSASFINYVWTAGTVAAVPEPGSLALLGLGLLGLIATSRQKSG